MEGKKDEDEWRRLLLHYELVKASSSSSLILSPIAPGKQREKVSDDKGKSLLHWLPSSVEQVNVVEWGRKWKDKQCAYEVSSK